MLYLQKLVQSMRIIKYIHGHNLLFPLFRYSRFQCMTRLKKEGKIKERAKFTGIFLVFPCRTFLNLSLSLCKKSLSTQTQRRRRVISENLSKVSRWGTEMQSYVNIFIKRSTRGKWLSWGHIGLRSRKVMSLKTYTAFKNSSHFQLLCCFLSRENIYEKNLYIMLYTMRTGMSYS